MALKLEKKTLVYVMANAKRVDSTGKDNRQVTIFKYEVLVVQTEIGDCPDFFTLTVWNKKQADALKVGKFYTMSNMKGFKMNSSYTPSGYEYSAPFKFKEHTEAVDNEALVRGS